MILCSEDTAIMAHRGSYKTTCAAFAIAFLMLLQPNSTHLFVRKTFESAKEFARLIFNILNSDTAKIIAKDLWNVNLAFEYSTASTMQLNLCTRRDGTPQFKVCGINSNVTGQHFDRIHCDDISDIRDRTSQAIRENTKRFYQELRNVVNRGGIILNTMTPWHKDDASSLLTNIQKHDCYSTSMISNAELTKLKNSMSASLFSANYELKFIPDTDLIFANFNYVDKNITELNNVYWHIDAAYGGNDTTALTLFAPAGNGRLFGYGRIFDGNIIDIKPRITSFLKTLKLRCGFVENNADKGTVYREFANDGLYMKHYHESDNKHAKISTHGVLAFKKIDWLTSTDDKYIEQIAEYNAFATRDDAPDSMASLYRIIGNEII